MDPSEPELTAQQAERVRRLLREARHDEPVPDDVAERLDRVIAGLGSQRDDQPDDQPDARQSPGVVRLDERRRRAGRLLLAAAAVVVGGVAVGQVLGGIQAGGDESAGSSVPAAEQEAEGEGLAAPDRDEPAEGGGGATDDAGPGAVTSLRQSVSKLPPQRLRSTRFAADAERLRPAATGQLDAPAKRRSTYVAGDVGSCAPGSWGGGRYLRVSFDREAGWLVYRPPRGDTQVVDLFLCGDDSPERSATLPYE